MFRKKLIISMLAAAAILTGCSQKEADIQVALSDYAIVRSDYADSEDIKLAVSLRNKLEESGAALKLTTDYLNKRTGEEPGEFELLFGMTEREESIAVAEEFSGDENEYIVKPVGSKLVILANSRHGYESAIDWLCEIYDSASGNLSIPENGYIGRWTPPLEGFEIDGTPISEFRIVKEDILDRELDELALKLQETLCDLTGFKPEIVGDDTERTGHEIIIGSKSVGREIPATNGFSDGNLIITARTNEELSYFIENLISGLHESGTIGGINMNESIKTTIRVSGKTPTERGKALSDALAKAEQLAKSATAQSPQDITLELDGGEYYLAESLTFGSNHWSSLTIKPSGVERPIIAGLTEIPDEAFVKVEGTDYYMAKLDCENGVKLRDFYCCGKRIPLASSENGVMAADFDVEDRKAPENARGVYVDKAYVEGIEDFTATEFNIYVEWEAVIMHVSGVDWSDTKTVDGRELVRLKFRKDEMEFFPRALIYWNPIINRKYFISNNRAFLKPGSCVADYENGILYYYPESGAPIGVSYSDEDILLNLKNASNVTIDGIGFIGSACTYTAKSGYFAEQANGEKRGGVLDCAAIHASGCTNIVINNCTFEELGGNGVQTKNFMKNLTVTNCRFNNTAMSALTLGNHDTGWDSDNANYNFIIENNTITNVGFEYPTSVAVYISHIDGLKLRHNTIDNCPYSGISVGWGWTVVDYDYGEMINIRNAEIAYNRITDYMSELRDGAAIYVLGANCTEKYTGLFNSMHDNFAKKSDYAPNTGHICGYYLDGSSSNWHLYDNVISGALYPLFAQFHVKSQYNHNVLCERLYTTEPVDMGNASIPRNVKLSGIHTEPTLDELYDKYPEAKAISDNSGAK